MDCALVLCSGGLDSVTTAHYVKKVLKYGVINILFFNYCQRTLEEERRAAKECAKDLGAEFIEINLDWVRRFSDSMINSNDKAKKINRKDLGNTEKESKKWYVPYRNSIFLSCAFSVAESLYIKENEKYDIFVGFKNEGKESYPDTTKNFIESMNNIGKINNSGGFEIIAPLIDKDKEDIVLMASKMGIDMTKTFSCYVGPNIHCGNCLACKLRQEGFYWANVKDPTEYAN